MDLNKSSHKSGSNATTEDKLLDKALVHVFRGILVVVRNHSAAGLGAVNDPKETAQYRKVRHSKRLRRHIAKNLADSPLLDGPLQRKLNR